jgi:hypothetical protein
MGQTARTTKLLLDLSKREQGGANRDKRRYLQETVNILDAARRFYLDFFLAHPDKLMEGVEVISTHTGEATPRLISADKLLTWAEFQTVATDAHPDPRPAWNFSQAFPDFPNRYRRAAHQRLRWQSPWLSHHACGLSTFRQEERETGYPHGGQSSHALRRDLCPGAGYSGSAQELYAAQSLYGRAMGVGPLPDSLQPVL